MKHSSVLRIAVACMAVTAGLSACRAGFTTNDDIANDPNFWRFTGAGSNWVLEIEKNGDGFELTRSNQPGSSVNITLTGTYESFANNGFTRLNVDEQTGTSSANSEITLVRASNYAAFLSPIFSSDGDEVMAMVASTNCGSNDTSSNWIRFKHPIQSQADIADPKEFGTLLYDDSEGELTLENRYELDAPSDSLSSLGIDSGECIDGYIDPGDHTHYLGSSDSALLDLFNNNDDQNQRLFAMDKSFISANTDYDGTAYGIMFDGGASSNKNIPIRVDCSSGNCPIEQISDIENGSVLSNDNYTLTLSNNTNSPSEGFITGEVSINEGQAQTVACIMRLSNTSNEDILACVGKSPNNSNQMLNIFLVR